MDQQFRARAIVAGSGTRQLRQHRAGRETNLHRVTARWVPAYTTSVIPVRCPADAVVKTDVARKTGFVVTREENDRSIRVVEGITANIAVIVTLPGDDIGIAPARPGSAPRQLMMEVGDVRHFVVTVLTQVIRLRDNRESA